MNVEEHNVLVESEQARRRGLPLEKLLPLVNALPLERLRAAFDDPAAFLDEMAKQVE